ncbi:N-acetyltransferase family protein [Macrococcus hajekii]|uniref:N-acetyltransferase family protein n=1 Tax=Macrococcus hajekii TaxID=198482 RepID=A0A4R6BMY9_9STAP|nr:arsinothricin resistance N-acetyltransferase ArsN1 family A [Macrococcus hajekii]TDM03108.1 N-acetyltransferase family protein [Macrococcus hajekii]GGA96028.1 N-acetyltransferase [Macrococcus hajekii]
MNIRHAELRDIPFITEIYNQGIEDGVATLEARGKTEEEMTAWLFDRAERYRVLVIEDENVVIGWTALQPYRFRAAYEGVAEFSIYIARYQRGRGVGRLLLNALQSEAKENNFYKLLLMVLEINESAYQLYLKSGFRTVGIFEKHGYHNGNFYNVRVMEKLL